MMPEIVTRIRVDTSPLKSGLAETKRELQSVTSAVTSFRGVLAAAAGSTLVLFARNALNAAGSLGEMSQRIGVNVESLQQLQHAARQSDVSVGELETGLRMLNRSLGEAAVGSVEQVRLFKQIGVSVTDSTGRLRDASNVLDEVADVIAKTESPAKRTQIAMEAFGRSGTQLLPMLQGGSVGLAKFREEAERLGLALDERLVNAADAASDTLDKATKVIGTNLTRAIITVAPHIESLSQLVAELAANWGSFVDYLMPAALAPSGELANRVAEAREQLRLLKEQRAETFGGMLRPSPKQFDAAIATAQAKLSELELRLRTTLREETKSLQPKPVSAPGPASDEQVGALLDEIESGFLKIGNVQRLVRDLANEQKEAMEGLSGALTAPKITDALDEIEAGVKHIADAERDFHKELQALPMTAVEVEKMFSDSLDKIESGFIKVGNVVRSIKDIAGEEAPYHEGISPTTLRPDKATEAYKKLTDELETHKRMVGALGKEYGAVAAEISATETALREMVRNGLDITDERVAKLSERLKELKQTQGLKDAFLDVFSSVGSAIEKMATGVIQGTLKMRDAFRNLAQSIIVEFAQKVIRQALNPLIESLAQAAAAMFGGGAGGILGRLGSTGALLGLAGMVAPAGIALGGAVGGENGRFLTGGFGGAGLLYGANSLLSTYLGRSANAVGYAAGTGAAVPYSYYPAAGLGNLYSLGGLSGGLNMAAGGLSLAGALSGNRYMSNAGQLLNVGSVGAGLASSVMSGGLGTAAAAYGAGTAGIGTVAMAAMPYVAAAVLAATSIYNAFQVSGKNWKNLGEGQRTGTRIGALASPVNLLSGGLLGALVPEKYSAFIDPIGGFVGGLIGSFFDDEPYITRVEVPQMEKISGLVSARLQSLADTRTPAQLMSTIGAGMPLDKWGNMRMTFGGQDVESADWNMLRQLAANPSAISASLRVGTSGFPAGRRQVEEQATEFLRASVVAKIQQFDAINSEINAALADMLKAVAIPPKVSTSAEALKRQTENFRAILGTITGAADAEIARQRTILLGLTDPEQILQQTQTIRSLLEERYNSEIQLVQQFVASVEQAESAWRGMREAIEEQIVALRLSGYGPTNPSEAVALTRGRFDEALAAFRSGPSAEGAQRVSALAEPFLEAASRQFSRPSQQFREIFDQVTSGLNEIAGYARSREEELQRAIVDALGVNASSITGAINTASLIDQLQVTKTEELNAAIDRLRVDTADVFEAMGFQITDGLGVSAAKLAEIKSAQDAVAAAVANAPATTNSLLGQIAAYSATIAANTTRGPVEYILPPGTTWARTTTDAAAAAAEWKVAADLGFSAASGLEYVPYDEFPARLHRGEAVLTAQEAEEWRRGESDMPGVVVTFAPGSIVVQGAGDPEAVARATAREIRREFEESIAIGPTGMAMADRASRWRR